MAEQEDDIVKKYLTDKYLQGAEQDPRAIDAANSNRLVAQLGRAGSLIGGGIAGTKVDEQGWKALLESANAPIEQDKQRMAAEGEKRKVLDYLSDKDLKLQQLVQAKNAKDSELAYKKERDKKDDSFKAQELALKAQEYKSKAPKADQVAYDALPKEKQKQIDSLGTKMGVQTDVKSGLDAGLANINAALKAGDEGQAVVAGKQLIKLLNSAEGSDAVGAEESKRLAGYLEYKIANFTEPGSFIGRDLDKFVEQVSGKAKEIDARMASNQAAIDKIYGRQPQVAQAPGTPPISFAPGALNPVGTSVAGAGQKPGYYVGQIMTIKKAGKPVKVRITNPNGDYEEVK